MKDPSGAKHFSTVSNIMETALKELYVENGKENGLGVDPSKIELFLFRRKYKVPKIRLKHSKEAKYSRVDLYFKISWKRSTEKMMKKRDKCIL